MSQHAEIGRMSSQGPAIVHYEVYAQEGERWTLHARFRKDEREDAMEEAKTIESSLGNRAKIIRETYYPGDNTSEEALVYKSDKNFKPRQRATAPRARAYARGDAALSADIRTPDFRKRQTAKAAPGSVGVIIKLILVVAAALLIAFGVSAIVGNFLARVDSYGVTIRPNIASLSVFATFVLVFLASAVPLALKVFDWRAAQTSSRAPVDSRRTQAPTMPVEATVPVEPPPQPEPPPTPEATETDVPPPDPVAEPAEAAPPAEVPPQPVPDTTAEAPATAEAAPDGTPGPDETDGADRHENPLEDHRMMMIRLLSSLLGEIQKTRPALDAYNLFGIDLVLAGAIDVLGTEKQLSVDDKRQILKETIEVMGTKSDTARTFADKYEEYLGEPKYMSMVQVGRNNMEALLAGADMSADQVATAFISWNRPQPSAQSAPGTMTILFTDMVGSTDLTQSRGDHAAQDIVRRHNSIVRSALAEHAGKEIKHTGDGIMASFASATSGVEAAIAIQKACRTNNERSPDAPLHLRIGINTGEPIQEEDDLFGTTVQLSARVCAKASADEILCTNVVRELSAGKDLSFQPLGVHDLKGFKDPIPLFSVRWSAAPEATAPGATVKDATAKDGHAKDPAAKPAGGRATSGRTSAKKEGRPKSRSAPRPDAPADPAKIS
jgi:adenylate cyclase